MVVSRLKFQNFLDKGQFFKCYFLFGSEFFIIQKSVEQLVNLVVEKQAQGCNFIEFDDEVDYFDSRMNCGFLISLKPKGVKHSKVANLAVNKTTEYVIHGSYLKEGSL